MTVMVVVWKVDVLAQQKAQGHREGYRVMPAPLPHATPMHHHKVDPNASPSAEMRTLDVFD